MHKQEYAKTLWSETFTATGQARVHANDHSVDLHFVHGTREGGRIGKDDVQAYIEAGKPVNRKTEFRYPTRTEIIAEMNVAFMHVTQQLDWEGQVLYTWLEIEKIDGVKVPVVYIEWGIRHRPQRANILHRRDARFSALRPRMSHPWGKRWGAR